MNQKRILFFAPFGSWQVHHQVDAVLAAALRERRCDVRIVYCDGVFKNCHLARNDLRFCQNCSKNAEQLFATFKLPLIQLSTFLSDTDYKDCTDWSQSLAISGLSDAQFEGHRVASYVQPGLCSFFVDGLIDYSKPEVVDVSRSFLNNSALITRAFGHLMRSFYPDHVVCYNSILAYYRTVFELCRSQSIPVLVHERGLVNNSFTFFNNENFAMSSGRAATWKSWSDIPLNTEECLIIKNHFIGLESGKNTNCAPFYNFSTDDKTVRDKLGIPGDVPIVALFATTDKEYEMNKKDIPGTYESQLLGLQQIIDIFSKRNEFLVIRNHPYRGGTFLSDAHFIERLFSLNRKLPDNVRMIMPYEKITSYSIAWNSDAAATFGSTMGVEAAARGIGVCSFFDTVYSALDIGIEMVHSPELCKSAIDRALAKTGRYSVDDLRKIYRGAYYNFFRLSDTFRSFGIIDNYKPDIRVKSFTDLADGNDATLDRICNHILYQSPLYPLPSEEQKQRSQNEETNILAQALDEVRQKRDHLRCFTGHPSIKEKKEPLVSIIRIRQNGIRAQKNTVLSQSLTHSRHKNIETIREMGFSSNSASTVFIKELTAAAHSVNGDYIYLGIDNTHLDESLFSNAVDFFENPENRSIDCLVTGAWICDKSGKIVDQFLTEWRDANTFEAVSKYRHSFANPLQLISFFIWRKSSLLRMLSELGKNSRETHDISTRIYETLFSSNGVFQPHKNLLPLITVYAQPSMDEVIATGKRLSDERNYSSKELHYKEIAASVESIEGYLVPGQEKFLFDKVKSLPDSSVIVEIGSCYGRSTAAMAFACVGTNKRIISVDRFADPFDADGKDIYNVEGAKAVFEINFFDIFERNIRQLGLENYIVPIIGPSHETLMLWKDKLQIDFVFIDGSHHYSDVSKDFELVYPLVKEGGFIAFHDIDWPGPGKVWSEEAKSHLISHEFCANLACGQKKSQTNNVTSFQPKSNYSFVHSENMDELLDKAIFELNRNNNAEALSLLDQTISEYPGLYGINYGKAIALIRLGKNEYAAQTLRELLAVMPHHIKARKLMEEIQYN